MRNSKFASKPKKKEEIVFKKERQRGCEIIQNNPEML
jgi:hypothetical protein